MWYKIYKDTIKSFFIDQIGLWKSGTTFFELLKILALKHGEPKSPAGNTYDIIIDSGNDEIEVLDVAGVFGVVGGFGDDANVGKFTIVSRSHRIEAVEIKRVRVKVITSLSGNTRYGNKALDWAIRG